MKIFYIFTASLTKEIQDEYTEYTHSLLLETELKSLVIMALDQNIEIVK